MIGMVVPSWHARAVATQLLLLLLLLLLLQLAGGQHQNPHGPCALNPGTMYGYIGVRRSMEGFTLGGRNATIHDYSKDQDGPLTRNHRIFCHLDPRPACNSSCMVNSRQPCGTDAHYCVIPVGEQCEVDCDRGHRPPSTGSSGKALRCSPSAVALIADFECPACPPDTYKGTVGNERCSACEQGQTTVGWTGWSGEGAQTCRPAGTDWCSGTLPVAHSRDDACSAQAGSVSSGGNKIKPGDICTIAPGYNPFDPGWIRTDRQRHIFECGFDGEWSQQTPHPLTPRRGTCNASSCFTTPKLWGETGCHHCGDPAYAQGIACGNCSGEHHVGDVCTVGCPDGYRPRASSRTEYWTGALICNAEEQWVPTGSGEWTLPHVIDYTDFCEKLTCDPMPQPVGESKGTSVDPRCTAPQVEEGVTCSATCGPGYYRSSGDSSRTCTRGSWSGEPLVCTKDGRCASELGRNGWQENSQLMDTACDTRCGKSCKVECKHGYYREAVHADPFEVQCQCNRPDGAAQPVNEWVPTSFDPPEWVPGSCLGCHRKGELVRCV
eukprot:COSAG02_NODE_9459_length_2209_cov_6.582938_1_plen_548_part_01